MAFSTYCLPFYKQPLVTDVLEILKGEEALCRVFQITHELCQCECAEVNLSTEISAFQCYFVHLLDNSETFHRLEEFLSAKWSGPMAYQKGYKIYQDLPFCKGTGLSSPTPLFSVPTVNFRVELKQFILLSI